MSMTCSEFLQGGLWRIGARDLGGFAYDPAHPSQRFVVEVLIDGLPAMLARANAPIRGLPAGVAAPAAADCGFSVALRHEFAARIEVRIANHGAALGAPLSWSAEDPPAAPAGPGEVEWDGGLRLTGWVPADGGRTPMVSALIDGVVVAEIAAAGWSHGGDGAASRASRRFDVDLPRRFADGRVHFVEMRDENGVELAASPCAIVAYDKGLTHFLTERGAIARQKPLVELFEKITPQIMPLADFRAWRDEFPPPPVAAGARLPKMAVALIGENDLDLTLASLEAQQGVAWVAAVLEGGASAVDFDPRLLRGFVDGEAAQAEILVFAPAGAVFAPGALAHFAVALAQCPEAPFAYADVALRSAEGGLWPLALPAHDYERQLEQGYCSLFVAARKNLVIQALDKGASSLFRLTLAAQDVRPAPAPVHVPLFLAELPWPDVAALRAPLTAAARDHLAARGVAAALAPGAGALLPALQIGRPLGDEKISVLIPTRDRADLLRVALESLSRTLEPGRCEILIIDNESVEAETRALFAELARRGGRIIPAPGPFNFSRLINLGAAAARGDHLLLLNNDVEARRPGWLEEMHSRLREPDVGAVGAGLLWPSGVVQHGGVVLGPKFAAVHAFNDRIDTDPGYGDLMAVAHECSAVTAACLLTPRALFEAVGGFDEQNFPVNFNDVDYCLKLRALGRRIIQTPRARLIHRESASRGRDRRPDQAERFQRELRLLRARWGEVIAADPFYNPQLALLQTPYAALAFPPGPRTPRQPHSPPPRPLPRGF